MKQTKHNLERLIAGVMLSGAALAPAAADDAQDRYSVLSEQDTNGTVIQYDFDGDGQIDDVYMTQKTLTDDELDTRVVETLNENDVLNTRNIAYKMTSDYTGENIQLRVPENEVYKQKTPIYTGAAPKIE